ncbi:cryptochrome/photolyase family protein [Ferribacterium limneticum]|uniref:cryptochrome/photolyase family protein n=1 Tax=Ferribacterium limneticum TaxID=76259 RepID=UPI001CFA15CE|nr:deoxyribodipyrimidine photo-lyase [Ferribacterium limneticum]UCV28216.1 deoxyribodipyrimidine photo-lyase [Ferribacterium limneticum]UCV32133.1 deoxyribodipyrimidine photo-lyase [Ferribacterium limneticum]
MNKEKALVWFRRDLRDHDHAALSAALAEAQQVYCAFVFDSNILDALPTRHDRRVHFIRESLIELDMALRAKGGGLIVRHGRAVDEIPALASQLGVSAIFTNRDYEPSAKRRDALVAEQLQADGIAFHGFKDQAIFDGDEVLTQAGKAFSVFTPYKNAWLKRLTAADCATWPCTGQLAGQELAGVPRLDEIGFTPTDLVQLGIQPGMSGAEALWDDFAGGRIVRYGSLRDFPAVKGVSYLSVHLRFGTISIRQLVRKALEQKADTWLSELIWRDFYFMILDHFPHVVGHAFKPEYDAIQWANRPEAFAAWCEGRTGYPLVDAAMRQLNHSGWMHNRLRMVVASFLTKDLGLDWRLGEQYFAEQLNDFDLSANNGGWQWASSSGCDAQPYFRIFNPITQSEKFDAEGKFIRRYVPELAKVPDKYIHAPWKMGRIEQEALGVVIGRDYPAPIIDHATARDETLARYAVVKKQA